SGWPPPSVFCSDSTHDTYFSGNQSFSLASYHLPGVGSGTYSFALTANTNVSASVTGFGGAWGKGCFSLLTADTGPEQGTLNCQWACNNGCTPQTPQTNNCPPLAGNPCYYAKWYYTNYQLTYVFTGSPDFFISSGGSSLPAIMLDEDTGAYNALITVNSINGFS